MDVEYQERDSTYTGTDAEAAEALEKTFPTMGYTKACLCIDGGVTVRNKTKTINTGRVPDSVTVLCSQCGKPYDTVRR